MKNLQKLHWGAKLQLNITMSSIKCNCSALKAKIISWRTKIAYAIVKFTYFENENIVVTEYQYVLYFITPQTKFEARQCFHRCLFVHGEGGLAFQHASQVKWPGLVCQAFWMHIPQCIPPWEQTLLDADHCPWDTTGYNQQAGGTHPTVMHSCGH